MMTDIARWLIGLGFLLMVAGVGVWMFARLGVSRLPGDIVWQRGNFTLYVPLATMLLVSIVLTLLMNLFARWRQ